MIAKQSTLSEPSVLTALTLPGEPGSSNDFAQWMLGVRFTDQADVEIRTLLEKNNQGTISEHERALLDRYLSLGQVVDIFQATARLAAMSQAEREIPFEEHRRAFAAFRQIVEITADVFQQQPRVKTDQDPEFPDDKYVVLVVETRLDRKAILEKEDEWTRRVARVEPQWDAFRLSVKLLK